MDSLATPRAIPRYAVDAARPDHLRRALADIGSGFAQWRLAWALAWLDIRNRYRGSVLGPVWVTLSMGAMILGLGLLYSTLFRLQLRDYLPHLTVSLVVWNVIAQTVNDATTSLTSSEGIIRQMPLPYTVHGLRCVFRNAIVAAHILPLIVIVFALCAHVPGPEVVLAIPGLLLIGLNALAIALFLGMVCARFRDIGPIVASVMQLAFFMTPILWKPELLGDKAWLALANPFYALLETVRGPLVEGGGPAAAWMAAIGYSAIAIGISVAFFIRFRGRVAYWV